MCSRCINCSRRSNSSRTMRSLRQLGRIYEDLKGVDHAYSGIACCEDQQRRRRGCAIISLARCKFFCGYSSKSLTLARIGSNPRSQCAVTQKHWLGASSKLAMPKLSPPPELIHLDPEMAAITVYWHRSWKARVIEQMR